MPEISPKVEEFKERVRSRYPRRKEPNFRIPWYVLVVNMLLIAYILFIYGRRPSDDEPGTTIIYGGAEYRLSIVRDASSGEKIAALTVRNIIEGNNTLSYEHAVATIEFIHGKKSVIAEKIGDGITHITFSAGEVRTFIVPLAIDRLFEYAKTNKDTSSTRKRSLISLEAEYFPYSARLTIHTALPVMSIFEYRLYGVR